MQNMEAEKTAAEKNSPAEPESFSKGCIETPKDVLDACSCEVKSMLKAHSTIIILYGSFAYRDISIPVSSFESIEGKGGAFDQKPDFIAGAQNIDDAIRSLGKAKEWSQKSIKKILRERKDTPFYFNLETRDSYKAECKNGSSSAPLRYKIAVVGLEHILGNSVTSKSNAYLARRLSKPLNIIMASKPNRMILEYNLKRIRNHYAEFTLRLLPEEFSGEDFAKKYFQVTYLAEAYRFFDIKNKKHEQILESQFYDIKQGTAVPMRQKLAEDIAGIVCSSQLFEIKGKGDSFYSTVFSNKGEYSTAKTILQLAASNIYSFNISMGKNRRTNRLAGGNGISYVARKFSR